MARMLAVMLMALAFAQAGALSPSADSAAESEADRPHGARRRALERARTAQTASEVADTGCAQLGGGEKWFSDPHGELFQVTQDHCMITFGLKTKRGDKYEKRGVVRGTTVLVEPPFPEGQVVNGNVKFENGAQWNREW